MSPRYETVWVLAGAYKGKGKSLQGPMLTHVVDNDSGEPLCRKVKGESLCDTGPGAAEGPGTVAATCSTCAKRDPRKHEP